MTGAVFNQTRPVVIRTGYIDVDTNQISELDCGE
jgi:hypothetical protein